MKQILIDFYLDWVNNYLTTEKMASDYGLTERQVFNIIEVGRELHEQNVKDIKQAAQTNSQLIEKCYDYIVRVTQKQGRLLDKKTLYGDGSIYNFNYELFNTIYEAIEKELSNEQH